MLGDYRTPACGGQTNQPPPPSFLMLLVEMASHNSYVVSSRVHLPTTFINREAPKAPAPNCASADDPIQKTTIERDESCDAAAGNFSAARGTYTARSTCRSLLAPSCVPAHPLQRGTLKLALRHNVAAEPARQILMV